MRSIRNLVLIFVAVGVLAALFNADAAFTVDSAAQTQSFIKSIITTLVGIAGAVAVVFMVNRRLSLYYELWTSKEAR